jgi:hypothetical protein
MLSAIFLLSLINRVCSGGMKYPAWHCAQIPASPSCANSASVGSSRLTPHFVRFHPQYTAVVALIGAAPQRLHSDFPGSFW